MKIHVQTFQMPRWFAPLIALAALALIPFALMLALGLAALAVGASVFRAFLPVPDTRVPMGDGEPVKTRSLKKGTASQVSSIDVDYEIKDENEKS